MPVINSKIGPLTIVGPKWPSTEKLIEWVKKMAVPGALSHRDWNVTLHWGLDNQHIYTQDNWQVNNIRRRSNLEQLQIFNQQDVPTIPYTTNVGVAKNLVADGHLVWGRTAFHSQGRDIIGPGPAAGSRKRFNAKWLSRDYWVKVMPDPFEEWRFHIFNGKSIMRTMKVQVGETTRVQPVRNRVNGWHLTRSGRLPEGVGIEDVRAVCKQATGALEYLSGAVDIIILGEDHPQLDDGHGRIRVLEVNRAPGLDDRSARTYALAIAKWANSYTKMHGLRQAPFNLELLAAATPEEN